MQMTGGALGGLYGSERRSPARSMCTSISLLSRLQAYMRAILKHVSGMKVLLLDAETFGIVSLIVSQQELLHNEVLFVDNIEKTGRLRPSRNSVGYFSALCFLRPSETSLALLLNEVKTPLYGGYHLFFSAPVEASALALIAAADVFRCVRSVQVFYADVEALNANFFVLDPRPPELEDHDPAGGRAPRRSATQRVTEGLLSAVACSGGAPYVGVLFPGYSVECQRLAAKLLWALYRRGGAAGAEPGGESRPAAEMGEEQPALFLGSPGDTTRGNGSAVCAPFLLDSSVVQKSPGLIVFFDRRDDPVTPLLTQWTYQAMVHALLGLTRNRVKLPPASEDKGGEACLSEDFATKHEAVLSFMTEDPFFLANWNTSFGDLGRVVQELVQQYEQKKDSVAAELQEGRSSQRAFETAVGQFFAQVNAMRRWQETVSSHVRIIHALSQRVEKDHLLELSALEQDLVTQESTESRQLEHFRAVCAALDNPKFRAEDKLRLATLYALRYAGELSQSSREPGSPCNGAALEQAIVRSGMSYGAVEDMKRVLCYVKVLAGPQWDAARPLASHAEVFRSLSGRSRLMNFARNVMQRRLRKDAKVDGVNGALNQDTKDSIYTRHRCLLAVILEHLLKGAAGADALAGWVYSAPRPPGPSGELSCGAWAPHQMPITFDALRGVRHFIVFVVGGVTYQEAVQLGQLEREYGCAITLGGTYLLNATDFWQDALRRASHVPLFPGTALQPGAAVSHDDGGLNGSHHTTGSSVGAENTEEPLLGSSEARSVDLHLKRAYLRGQW